MAFSTSSASPLITLHDPPSSGAPHPAYANITTVPLSANTTLITIAGQTANQTPTTADPTKGPSSDARDNTIPESVGDQLDICIAKVKACLASVGASIHDTIRVVYYVVDWKENMYKDVVPRIEKGLEGHRPASCFLGVQALARKEFKCEVEAMAAVWRGE